MFGNSVKPILQLGIFEFKSLFISREFNIPGVIAFYASVAVEKITIRWIALSSLRTNLV